MKALCKSALRQIPGSKSRIPGFGDQGTEDEETGREGDEHEN